MYLCGCRATRSQGGPSSGHLVLASDGRVLDAALRQQHEQLVEMQTVMEAATGVVAQQAAHIARLEQQQQQQQLQLLEAREGAVQAQAAVGSRDASPVAAAAAGGCTDRSSSPAGRGQAKPAAGRLSPAVVAVNYAAPAGVGFGQRPGTAGSTPPSWPKTAGAQLGMTASMKADLEAWRAK